MWTLRLWTEVVAGAVCERWRNLTCLSCNCLLVTSLFPEHWLQCACEALGLCCVCSAECRIWFTANRCEQQSSYNKLGCYCAPEFCAALLLALKSLPVCDQIICHLRSGGRLQRSIDRRHSSVLNLCCQQNVFFFWIPLVHEVDWIRVMEWFWLKRTIKTV